MMCQPLENGLQPVLTSIAVSRVTSKVRCFIFSKPSLKLYYVLFIAMIFLVEVIQYEDSKPLHN